MPALRRHRLTEVFLVKVMGYDWASAHELSDVLEKGFNDELEDRAFELAGRPTRCPHGEPIPSKDGIMPEIRDEPLVDVPSGSDCIVSRVRTHNPDKLRYIAELGLVPGVSVSLVELRAVPGPAALADEFATTISSVTNYQDRFGWRSKNLGDGNKLPPLKVSPS